MRIALGQLNPHVGDVAGNAARILEAIDRARAGGADLLVTSELALLGYPPRDLILRRGVVEACERGARAVVEASRGLTVIFGHPRVVTDDTHPVRNSATIARDGEVVAVYDKRLFPGYDVFDEDRYFAPGRETCVLDIAGRRVGVVICEDLWRAGDASAERRYPVDPVGETLAAGADLLVSLNATPFVHGKWLRHHEQVAQIATTHDVDVVMVNQVGGFDDLVFDGRSMVMSRAGSLVEVLPGFETQTRVVDLADGATLPASEYRLAIDQPLRELYMALVLGVSDYSFKTGHDRALLGISGGIDSALVAAIAAAALGASNITGVMMPSRYSSAGSLVDANALAARLKLGACVEMPIEDLHQTARSVYREAGQRKLEGVADENIQARIRGLMLMALSNSFGALLLATGNKSELAVGYSTLYGDMNGAISVIGDLRKMQVYDLSRWINEHQSELGFESPPIPEATIDKVPSAELRPDQTDQDTLPPYELLDDIIERYIDRELDIASIVEETGFDVALVRRIAKAIDRNEFKRHQASIILKVSPRAFGRGRPYPLAMSSVTGYEQTESGRADTQSASRDQ